MKEKRRYEVTSSLSTGPLYPFKRTRAAMKHEQKRASCLCLSLFKFSPTDTFTGDLDEQKTNRGSLDKTLEWRWNPIECPTGDSVLLKYMYVHAYLYLPFFRGLITEELILFFHKLPRKIAESALSN